MESRLRAALSMYSTTGRAGSECKNYGDAIRIPYHEQAKQPTLYVLGLCPDGFDRFGPDEATNLAAEYVPTSQSLGGRL